MTVLGAAREHDCRPPAIAADLDDGAFAHLPRQVVEENRGIAGQPPPDRGNLAQLLRPILSRGQACESTAATAQQTVLRLVPLIWTRCRSRPGEERERRRRSSRRKRRLQRRVPRPRAAQGRVATGRALLPGALGEA